MYKKLNITMGIIGILFSAFMIPSFFIEEWADRLGNLYGVLVMIYCAYMAIVLIVLVITLYRHETGSLATIRSSRLAESRKEYQNRISREREVLLKLESQTEVIQTAPISADSTSSPAMENAVAAEPAAAIITKELETAVSQKCSIDAPVEASKDHFIFTFLGHNYQIALGWKELFMTESAKPYFQELEALLDKAIKSHIVYPNYEDIFRAFEYTDLNQIKVVVLSKIPWYRKNQADGLAYSTKVGLPLHLTTQVIIEEAVRDVGIDYPSTGSLIPWAKQGVFLLNMSLTCTNAKPLSHLASWEIFTHAVFKAIIETKSPKVFFIWGEYAALYQKEIIGDDYAILNAANPSPLSASNGFIGSHPFSQANEFLQEHGVATIDWSLK